MSTVFDRKVAAGTAPLLGGKIALITGVANGIGAEALDLFTAAGATVAGSDVNQAALDGLAAKHEGADLAQVDVTDAAAVEKWIADVITKHGRIDVVFHSAGVGTVADKPVDIVDTTDEVWDTTVGINLRGTFVVSRAVVPHMRANGGSIVTVSSVVGLAGIPGATSYAASKGGVIAFTRALAVEGAEFGIRVNSLCPGWCDTDMVRDYLSKVDDRDAAAQALNDAHLVGRLGRPEEIAAAALWLSTDAASFITGAILPVDGGYTVR